MAMSLEIIEKILELIILPLFTALIAQLIGWIQAKKEESLKQTENIICQKYLKMLTTTIEDCVIATNQTYVNKLKDQNLFTPEAQKEAFNLTYEKIVSLLTEEAQYYLNEILEDLESYIKIQIEASVNINKQN